MQQDYYKKLTDTPLFQEITQEGITHMMGCLSPKVRHYTKQDLITVEGMPFEGIGILLEGRALITRSNEAGESILMDHVLPGQIFGEMIAFSSRTTWPATVVADSEVAVMFLDKNSFVSQCHQVCSWHQQLMLNLMRIISNKALFLNRKVNYLSIKSMRAKLSKLLLEFSKDQNGKMIHMPFNRNEMAEFLNVSRPSMSRELARMKKENLIDYHQNTFKILDLDQLKELASHF